MPSTGKRLLPHVENCHQKRGKKSAMKNAGRLQRFEGEDLPGVPDVIPEIKKKHEQLRADRFPLWRNRPPG